MALLLCLATAVCYAEMAKLYPGTGSSYYFAEQSFLNHATAWRYARLSKYIVGWGSHLYYWIYPGVMVGVMGILCGYLVGTLWPSFMNASNPGPAFMMAVAVVFSFAIAYIAHRGVNGSTAVNIAINVVQIAALVVFAIMALGYRSSHPAGSVGYQFDSTSGDAYNYQFATTKTVANGQTTETILRNADGTPKAHAGRRRQAGAVPGRLSGQGRKGQLPEPREQDFGGGAAQLQLDVHSGHRGHSDPGGFRIGDGHGRRGQERQARRADRGDRLAAGAGGVLLPV